MNSFAFSGPIVAGKTDAWRSLCADLSGSRRKEADRYFKKIGVSETRTWLQHTPAGDVAIVLHEGKSPERLLPSLRDTNDPFAIWFRDKLAEIHGSDTISGEVELAEQVTEIHHKA